MLPNADAGKLSNTDLGEIFKQFAEKRQPRTAELVKGARVQGENRVTIGEEACKQRNEIIKKGFADQEAVKAKMHFLYREPFERKVEVSA